MEQYAEIIDLFISGEMRLSSRSLLNYLSEDVEYFMLASRPDAHLLRQLRGRETVSEYLSILPLMYEIASRTINKVFQDGSHTVVWGRDLATIRPNKNKIITDWTAILVIQSGKIHRIQYIFQNMTDAA